MARIQPARARGIRVKLISYFTRRSLAKLSGRQPERMLEPLQMFAHSPALLNALPRYRDSQLFTELERLVLDYAVGMCRTPVDVPDELFARLRGQFGEAQLVELTYHIALENLRGRFNLALGIGPAGFSEGMVCAVPGSIERTE